VAESASSEEKDRWRRDYRRLREKYSNKEIAAKLCADEGNLSACGSGSKNPGKKSLKKLYMAYPELTESPEDRQTDSNENKEQQGYQQAGPTSGTMEEPAQVYQMNWDDSDKLRDELFSLYKNNDKFFKTEYSTMNKTIFILSGVVASYREPTSPGPDSPSPQG